MIALTNEVTFSIVNRVKNSFIYILRGILWYHLKIREKEKKLFLHLLKIIIYCNNSNIKYVNSIINIGFESFYYVINLDVVSYFVIFSDLIYY